MATAGLWAAAGRGAAVADAPALTAAEVRGIVARAADEAQRAGLRATIAVTDKEGSVLALGQMPGAPATSRVPTRVPGARPHGLEGRELPATAVAVTKAGTAAFLSSGGNAFSTRTASFIVQQHFPPGVEGTPGGPLFGVQLSSLPCTDVKRPALPLGLAGDPGGVPLYKDGRVVGGVGVEGDGVYGADLDPADDDVSAEERAALAGAVGFDAPLLIRADQILADGIRLPFANARVAGSPTGAAAVLTELMPPRDGQPSAFVPASAGGVVGEADPRFPTRGGSVLSATEVATILAQAARQASATRAAIRQPLGSDARVSIVVVDTDGSVQGAFRMTDAPMFGFDVAAQKARTAAFFSGAGAGDALRSAGFALYLGDDVPLDGSVAFTSRAVGFLAQPFYPPGIDGTDPGPFSVPIGEWSIFNTGLHLEVVLDAVLNGSLDTCSLAIPRLKNGITIFPGGVPLYKNGRLAGAVGISGDGVDQDDLIAAGGSAGFEAPPERRCDRLLIRGVRLPFVKFPRHPEL